MKLRAISCAFVFAVCLLLGCQSTDNGNKPAQVQTKNRYPGLKPTVMSVDATELTEIIPSVCSSLDITVKQTGEESGRYTWSCKSLGNLDVEIEAMALVKGKSLVLVYVGGGNWGQVLKRDLERALNSASRNHDEN